jgi:hypothetical protein
MIIRQWLPWQLCRCTFPFEKTDSGAIARLQLLLPSLPVHIVLQAAGAGGLNVILSISSTPTTAALADDGIEVLNLFAIYLPFMRLRLLLLPNLYVLLPPN